MRFRILVLLLLLGTATAAPAQINIGINFSLFPELVRVPDYPVYYAPRQNANYFFYDGMYWVYRNDDWYSSDWYNGPWWRTAPEYVPEYVLRVPVRYYRQPPPYFRGWQRNAPPRWGEHWGRDWEQRRGGWDKWDRRAAPRPAPLPTYQRKYSGNRYPHADEQHELHDRNYRYKAKDTLVREHVRPPIEAAARERRPEPRKDAGKDGRDREERSKDSGKDSRERDQRSNRPEQKSQQPAQRQAPAAQERPQDQRRERQESSRDARERDQRPAQKSEPAAQQPQPKPAVQQPRPQAPAAEPNKGRDRQDREKGQGQDKGQDREREKREERNK